MFGKKYYKEYSVIQETNAKSNLNFLHDAYIIIIFVVNKTLHAVSWQHLHGFIQRTFILNNQTV